MTKSLYDLCIPTNNVFDETKRFDVLDINNLIQNRINPQDFFEENFITQGMQILFETAFKRFLNKSTTGIIKLTQAMGGGKTHSMIALGLLAEHPDIREKVLGNKFKDCCSTKIKVVAFTGRESDTQLGIWGAIAEQLGKKELLKDYYSPLKAPGQEKWVELLKGAPLLILLDEIPPYLQNAMSIQIGNSDLSIVTTTALANMFTALSKEELSNVCIVISDLKATWESGSELLQSSFKELENEVSRYAINLEPVGSNSDEVYHILRKRLFKSLPANEDIIEIAGLYKTALNESNQMDYSNMSPEGLFIGIKDSYPFHPSIKDLYARFKENPGFQQTRGLIRLMRLIVRQLYDGDAPKAKKCYLINVYDVELNDREMLSTITDINPSLVSAISHDISSGGKSIAETIDQTLNDTSMSDVAKLLLMASLSNIPNALKGLTEQEVLGYMAQPNKDITKIKKSLDEFIMKSWYLYTDRDDRIYFRDIKNMIAQLNSLVESYTNDIAKKEIKVFLEEKFKPINSDCYQRVMVFPAIDEIELTSEKILLILAEPYLHEGLNPDLKEFYNNATYKNRVIFLSGQRNTMDNLIRVAKEFKAIKHIVDIKKQEKVPESDIQMQKAVELIDKKMLSLLAATMETFVTLYYPSKNDELLKADFLMNYNDNKYNAEQQIKKTLQERGKFIEENFGDSFRKRCEDRLFTKKEMSWNEIKERAAVYTSWPWYLPRALDDLKTDSLSKDIWRENGGYIEKGPFPPEETDLIIKDSRNSETGEVILKLIPQHGDIILYEIGTFATEKSQKIEDLNNFRTKELMVSFLCIDSKNIHPTGKPKTYINKVDVKYRKYTKGSETVFELITIPPKSTIRFTLDGSNPKENGKYYDGEFTLPENTSNILVVAEKNGAQYDVVNIKIDKNDPIIIDKSKKLKLLKKDKTFNTQETYFELATLKKFKTTLSDCTMVLYPSGQNRDDNDFVELCTGKKMLILPEKLEEEINDLKKIFNFQEKINIALECNCIEFESGQDFLDYVAAKKMSLENFKEEEVLQ